MGWGTIFVFQDITGINEMIMTNNLNVYPNPASDYISVEGESTINNILIANEIGIVVYQQNIKSTKTEINITNLTNGICQIKTSGNLQSGHSRLINNR